MTPDPQIRGVILYDGECGFCQSSIRLLMRWDRHQRILYAPLQGETAAGIFDRHQELDDDLDTVVYVRDWQRPAERPFIHSTAAIEVCRDIGGLPRLAVIFRIVPRSWRDAIYRFIARHRGKLAGKACSIAEQQEHRDRVLP